MRGAQLPRVKTWWDFDFSQAPHISSARSGLRRGGDIERSEPVVFSANRNGEEPLGYWVWLGGVQQKRRARFVTAARW